ncbi:MAG: HdeD family acid-resistance protein [bacterium]
MNADTTGEGNPIQSPLNFGKRTTIIGWILMIIGAIGMVLPQVMALQATLFIALLFLAGGIMWATHTFKYSRQQWGDWLKPILLIMSGGLMLFYPANGIAALGLLLAIYLMLDAFSSFTLAYGLHPLKGWGWMAFNGVLSLLLSVLFLIGWPETSVFLVGLYVAISLFFDGWSLLIIGRSLKQTGL